MVAIEENKSLRAAALRSQADDQRTVMSDDPPERETTQEGRGVMNCEEIIPNNLTPQSQTNPPD